MGQKNSVMPDLKSGIAFIYFNDYENSCKILAERFGFVSRTDYGYATMFEVNKGFFLGAVNIAEVSRSSQDEKMVTLCFTASSREMLGEWHRNLTEKGVDPTPIKKSDRLEYYAFKAYGPEGYNFEFGSFITPGEAMYYNPQG